MNAITNIGFTAVQLIFTPTHALGKGALTCAYGLGVAASVATTGALVIEVSSIIRVKGILSDLKEKQRKLQEM
jgi:hypothetical protein